MKKTTHTLLTAAAFAASLNMSAAGNVSAGTLSDVNAAPDRMGYDPSTEEVQDVYGPAPSYGDENLVYDPIVTSTVLDVQNIQTTYGPPIWRQDETTNTTAVSDVEDIIKNNEHLTIPVTDEARQIFREALEECLMQTNFPYLNGYTKENCPEELERNLIG